MLPVPPDVLPFK